MFSNFLFNFQFNYIVYYFCQSSESNFYYYVPCIHSVNE